MPADKTFSEIKFLNFYNDVKEIGTFPFVPKRGQPKLTDQDGGVARAKVHARIRASHNEDSKTVLVFLDYLITSSNDPLTAERTFMIRADMKASAQQIVEARTVQGVLSNAECYRHATMIFDEWIALMKVYQMRADIEFKTVDDLIDKAFRDALDAAEDADKTDDSDEDAGTESTE